MSTIHSQCFDCVHANGKGCKPQGDPRPFEYQLNEKKCPTFKTKFVKHYNAVVIKHLAGTEHDHDQSTHAHGSAEAAGKAIEDAAVAQALKDDEEARKLRGKDDADAVIAEVSKLPPVLYDPEDEESVPPRPAKLSEEEAKSEREAFDKIDVSEKHRGSFTPEDEMKLAEILREKEALKGPTEEEISAQQNWALAKVAFESAILAQRAASGNSQAALSLYQSNALHNAIHQTEIYMDPLSPDYEQGMTEAMHRVTMALSEIGFNDVDVPSLRPVVEGMLRAGMEAKAISVRLEAKRGGLLEDSEDLIERAMQDPAYRAATIKRAEEIAEEKAKANEALTDLNNRLTQLKVDRVGLAEASPEYVANTVEQNRLEAEKNALLARKAEIMEAHNEAQPMASMARQAEANLNGEKIKAFGLERYVALRHAEMSRDEDDYQEHLEALSESWKHIGGDGPNKLRLAVNLAFGIDAPVIDRDQGGKRIFFKDYEDDIEEIANHAAVVLREWENTQRALEGTVEFIAHGGGGEIGAEKGEGEPGQTDMDDFLNSDFYTEKENEARSEAWDNLSTSEKVDYFDEGPAGATGYGAKRMRGLLDDVLTNEGDAVLSWAEKEGNISEFERRTATEVGWALPIGAILDDLSADPGASDSQEAAAFRGAVPEKFVEGGLDPKEATPADLVEGIDSQIRTLRATFGDDLARTNGFIGTIDMGGTRSASDTEAINRVMDGARDMLRIMQTRGMTDAEAEDAQRLREILFTYPDQIADKPWETTPYEKAGYEGGAPYYRRDVTRAELLEVVAMADQLSQRLKHESNAVYTLLDNFSFDREDSQGKGVPGDVWDKAEEDMLKRRDEIISENAKAWAVTEYQPVIEAIQERFFEDWSPDQNDVFEWEQEYRQDNPTGVKIEIEPSDWPLTLHRGVRADTTNYQMGPVESWTLSPELTKQFGPELITEKFGRERILVFQHGPGWQTPKGESSMGSKEDEFMVLADVPKWMRDFVVKADKQGKGEADGARAEREKYLRDRYRDLEHKKEKGEMSEAQFNRALRAIMGEIARSGLRAGFVTGKLR